MSLYAFDGTWNSAEIDDGQESEKKPSPPPGDSEHPGRVTTGD